LERWRERFKNLDGIRKGKKFGVQTRDRAGSLPVRITLRGKKLTSAQDGTSEIFRSD
jgi:hypothetical protein